MHTFSPDFLNCISNPVSIEQGNEKIRFFNVIACSYAFELDDSNQILPFHQILEKINNTLEQYQIGIDECLPKAKSEFLAFGKNQSRDSNASFHELSISIGSITKTLYVYPERQWQLTGKRYKIIKIGNLENISINFQNAYGGQKYLLNPVGLGFINKQQKNDDHTQQDLPPLARIELKGHQLSHPFEHDQIHPGSFSPIPVHWELRKQFYGQPNKSNHPAIPKETDTQFYQSSFPDQQQKEPFKPGCLYSIAGMSESGIIKGQLPDYTIRIMTIRNNKLTEHQANCDTVLFFPNDGIGIVTYRAIIPVKTYDAKEIDQYIFALDHADDSLQRSKVEYFENMQAQFEDEKLKDINDDWLMPAYFSI